MSRTRRVDLRAEYLEDRTLLTSFAFRQIYSEGAGGSYAEVVGDYNHDGNLDVATVGEYGLAVLLGNGDGTLPTYQTWPLDATDDYGNTIAQGYFTGDGDLDLVAGLDSGPLALFMGDGKRGFQRTSLSVSASSALVGDVNGDGNADIVWRGGPAIGVLLGNGDGTFTAGPDITGFTDEQIAALADFTGGGSADLITADYEPGADGQEECTFYIRQSNGDGTFAARQKILTINDIDGGSAIVQTADLNDDGKLDLAVKYISGQGGGGIDVLLGNGDGTFQAPIQTPLTGGDPTGFALGDFNGDGKLDAAVTLFPSGNFAVLPGNGDGTFQTPLVFSANGDPSGLAAGDFDGDGHQDLVGIANDSPLVNVLMYRPTPANLQGTNVSAAEFAPIDAAGVATFTDPNADSNPTYYSVSIDWGDLSNPSSGTVTESATGQYTISGSHTYSKSGTFPITATVTDTYFTYPGLTFTVTGSATVTQVDLPLSASGINFNAVQSYSGTYTVASFTDADPTGHLGDYTASIDWGDGSSESDGTITAGSVNGQLTFFVSGAHLYNQSGTFTTTTTINAVDGAVASAVALAVVASGSPTPTPTSPTPTPTPTSPTPTPTPTSPTPTPTPTPTSPTPTPTPTSPTPTPTPTSPTLTPTPTPIQTQAAVIGQQPLLGRKRKKGKPTDKPVLSGFALDFGVALNSTAAANAANYQFDTVTTKKVKKKKEPILHPITKFTVAYHAASDAVEITLGAKETFPTGGQITVLGGLTTASGSTLTGNAVFTISKGGKSIGPS